MIYQYSLFRFNTFNKSRIDYDTKETNSLETLQCCMIEQTNLVYHSYYTKSVYVAPS